MAEVKEKKEEGEEEEKKQEGLSSTCHLAVDY